MTSSAHLFDNRLHQPRIPLFGDGFCPAVFKPAGIDPAYRADDVMLRLVSALLTVRAANTWYNSESTSSK